MTEFCENFFYEYKVIWYEEDKGEVTDKGITFGRNYSEAVERIESYYGDAIIQLAVYMPEDLPVYVLEGVVANKFFDNRPY